MFDLMWVLLAGWVGFLVGFLACSLVVMSSRRHSDEELDAAARDYYKL